MPHRIEDIAGLNEAAFRREVLIPLLEAMGYRDVEHYHGPNELGKDIVGWRQSEDGAREYDAVVAKVGDVNASATGDATIIATQVRQAFGSTFTNKVTGEPCQAHRVIVASSGTIPERSRQAILSQLDPARKLHVRFWDGDEVVRLLNEKLPVGSIARDLERVRAQLAEVESFEIEPTVTPAGTIFKVAPKEPGTSLARAQFSFPKDTDGRRVARSLQTFLDEGGNVTIPRQYIKEFVVQDELRRLFGSDAPEWIRIEQPESPKAIPIRLTTVDQAVRLDGLELRGWKAGRKEAKFRAGRNDALGLELILRRDKSITFKLQFRPTGHPVYRARQVVALSQALAEGAHLEIRHAHTNERLLRTSELSEVEGPAPVLVELLEALLELQEHFNTSFVLPERLTDELLDDVRMLREIIRSGKVRQPFGTFSATLSTRQARLILELYEKDSILHVTLQKVDAEFDLLGKGLALGNVVRYLGGLTLPAKEREKLMASVDGANKNHRLTLARAPDNDGIVTYAPRYLTGEDLSKYERMFGSLPDRLPPDSDEAAAPSDSVTSSE